jgi:hypothetical protein
MRVSTGVEIRVMANNKRRTNQQRLKNQDCLRYENKRETVSVNSSSLDTPNEGDGSGELKAPKAVLDRLVQIHLEHLGRLKCR